MRERASEIRTSAEREPRDFRNLGVTLRPILGPKTAKRGESMSWKQSGVVLVAALLAACGGGGGGTPAGPGAAVDLTGTWAGVGDSFQVTWQLAQDGNRVTGTSRYSDTDGFAGQGTVSGTVSGGVFSFTNDYEAASPSSAGCAEHATGTLSVTALELRGAYQASSSCRSLGSGQLVFRR